MKNKYQDFIIITLSLLFLVFALFNNNLITTSVISSINLWLVKVFPSLFPMILLNNILVDYNFPYYIIKLFKSKGLKAYIIILSVLSGSPNNSIIIKELYLRKVITLKIANQLLTYSFFSNPIFLIAMLSMLFNSSTVWTIIIISYISNIIISFFFKIDYLNISASKNLNHSLSNNITKSINILLLILGTISFYILLSSFIISLLNLNNINSLFLKGILEITQGLNYLKDIVISLDIKEYIALMFISFGGLSIHSQIKSILEDTSIKYQYFLFGRLLSLIISITLLFLVKHT